MTTDPKYLRQRTTFRVAAADGTIINWGWPTFERAEADAERLGNGAHVVRHDYEIEVTASDRVLIDAGIDEADWSFLRLAANRMLNMARDAGRPSDAMRSTVRAFQNGSLTRASFDATRPRGHYAEDVA